MQGRWEVEVPWRARSGGRYHNVIERAPALIGLSCPAGQFGGTGARSHLLPSPFT